MDGDGVETGLLSFLADVSRACKSILDLFLTLHCSFQVDAQGLTVLHKAAGEGDDALLDLLLRER